MSMPLICETVTANDLTTLRARRDGCRAADLVELRLDGLVDLDVGGALAGRRQPVIVTCRPQWEGGRFDGSEEERRRFLRAALDAGAEYVDVEWRSDFSELLDVRRGRGIVLSTHDFKAGVPSDLEARVAAMRATGAEIVKVAITASRLADCVPLLDCRRVVDGPLVLVAMGRAGIPTRVLAARFGSCWMYAGDAAPGQLSAERLLNDFRFRSLTGDSAVYGVTGRPLEHTLSPAMHNAAFASLALEAAYVPLEAADADDFMKFAAAVGVVGASITAPFKEELFRRVVTWDPESRRAGAINTVRRHGEGWAGTNTDIAGFLAPLRRRFDVSNTRCAIVGAGGAARAVAIALATEGGHVTVHARDVQKAETVAALVGGRGLALPPPPGSWDLLVNATPVGTFPRVEETPVAAHLLTGGFVCDLVYNPLDTRLLTEARAAGCGTLGGLEMLVAQAVLQCEWWTGQRPSATLLGEAALGALGVPPNGSHTSIDACPRGRVSREASGS
ncbi:MAG: type I 3-dehydroquinate dehydratase [Acidobacteria bacterium]|nr:type I 3-dehydroquinate dehydratase [Acidobacteriota bacterium]